MGVDVGLEARVARLEKSVRAWRLATGAAVAVATAFCCIGAGSSAPVQEEVRTRKLVLVNEQDQVVADLGYAQGKFSGIAFYDPASKVRVSGFGMGTDGSGAFVIATKDGRNVLVHSGAVNEKGIPLENIQEAMKAIQRAQQ